jgi:hypothetical protein
VHPPEPIPQLSWTTPRRSASGVSAVDVTLSSEGKETPVGALVESGSKHPSNSKTGFGT